MGKHQDTVALLETPEQSSPQRLGEVLRVLEKLGLLEDDATSYVEANMVKISNSPVHAEVSCLMANIVFTRKKQVCVVAKRQADTHHCHQADTRTGLAAWFLNSRSARPIRTANKQPHVSLATPHA